MIKLAVGIRQLFSSFDPCADSEDRYLYCVHIELAVYVPYVSFYPFISDGPFSGWCKLESLPKTHQP